MIFVKYRQHRNGHIGGGVVSEVLGDREDSYAAALQALAILHEVERISEAARQGVNEDDICRPALAIDHRNHFAEGATLVRGGTAGLGEDPHPRCPIFLNPAIGGRDLIGERNIVLLLPRGRHTGINDDPLALKRCPCRYHGSFPFEQGGEFAAEKPVD
ncbi:hypothetical protein ATE59_11465 [Sphingopyxis sp. A083]|nr:hypothetical protein [Sphingopyxis sp. A083]KTE76101.1 hypothetical protein ATE59_11465 [Sphingopyxis sp. A083]